MMFNVMCVFSCQAMGIALQEGLLNGLKKKKRPKVMYKALFICRRASPDHRKFGPPGPYFLGNMAPSSEIWPPLKNYSLLHLLARKS